MADKLINADELYLEVVRVAQSKIDNDLHNPNRLAEAYGMKIIANMIKGAPPVNAVRVVRCKDCEHYLARIGFCKHLVFDGHVEDMDYCSQGKRKDGDNV